MGLTVSPRVFTKILKPVVFATLRAKGHVSTAYIDDSCLQALSYKSIHVWKISSIRLLSWTHWG